MRTLTIFLLSVSVLVVQVNSQVEMLTFSLEELYSLVSFPGEGGFAKISDIAYDEVTGKLLVADEGRRRIYVFRSDGSPERILGTSTDIPAPSMIVPGSGPKLFIIESSTGRVFTMSREGSEEVVPFSIHGEVTLGECKAKGMVRGRSGKLYIMGTDGRSLLVCDSGGRFIRKVESGVNLKDLVSMTVDHRGRVLAAKRGMVGLFLFDESGEFLREIVIRDFSTTLALSEIGGVAVDMSGRIWLSYPMEGFLKVFDETGAHIADVGRETIPGGLFSPTDIELTPSGYLMILERGTNSIRCFSVEVAR